MMSKVLPSAIPNKGTPNAQGVLDAREWRHPVPAPMHVILQAVTYRTPILREGV